MNKLNSRLKFISLEAENALSYSHFKVPLDEQGLVLLQGQNGSGKSSLFSVLDNILYSTTTRDLKYKDLINIHHGKDYFAELKLHMDEVEYVIQQFRDHSVLGTGLKVFKKGELITNE